MASEVQDLDEVRRIVLEGLHGHPVRVYLFGSRARGERGKHSDIDVAVLPLSPLPVGTLSAIRVALEESRIPFMVDLVDLSTTDAPFRERVLREGVQWSD